MKKLKLLLMGGIPGFIFCGQVIAQKIFPATNISGNKIVFPFPAQPAWSYLQPAISYNVADCDECREGRFILNAPVPQIFSTSNSISFNQPITVITTPPKSIKTIKADLVYFEMVPDNDLCLPCNKDDGLYGHFPNGTNSQQWAGAQSNLNIVVTTPVTPCCGTFFRWCIRYHVEFTDCTVCNKIVCYEMKKEGCSTPEGVITGTAIHIIKSN